MASVEAGKLRKLAEENDGGAPPEMEVAPTMNNDSVPAVEVTVFVDIAHVKETEAVAGSSSGQRIEFTALMERLAGKPDSSESGSSCPCADYESSDRTEPLDFLPLESVDAQATSVPPEVPTLGEKEVEGMQSSVHGTGLPLPWATMDFDNPPSPSSSRKPGPKS